MLTIYIFTHNCLVLSGYIFQVHCKNFAENMVRAWYMDNEKTDQRLEHHRSPPKYIDLNELFNRTGVEYFQVYFISLR